MLSSPEKVETDKALQTIGLDLMFSAPQKRMHAEGVTYIELSRKYDIKIDIVKKKLKILQEKGIVRSIGVSPKFWRFDEYNFQKMNEDDPVYKLLCSNFCEIDFDQFFNY